MPSKIIHQAQLWLSITVLTMIDRLTAHNRPHPDQDSDRGDVPGWVMITVMTAT